MSIYKILAIVLIAGGTLGLIYGGFSFTTDTHDVELGSLSVSVDENEYVFVPIWAGIAGIVIGASMLVLPKKA
jgi:hypothetical protein